MTRTKSVTDRVNLLFRAFSDRTRLRLLCLLKDQGELCVGDIMAILEIDHQPKASQHLAFLRKAGLVSVRKSGLWCFYSIAPAQGEFHAKLLECVTCCFGEVPQIRADAARAKKIKRAGGCCPEPSKAKSKEGGSPRGHCGE